MSELTGHARRTFLHATEADGELTHHSVESIAEHVGYQDATALRRLMRRLLNVSPKQLRP
nr:AraC family transcriptional regulator [Pseudomonas sp. MWU15-20650]